MSKFFNETQEASRWAEKRLATQNLDLQPVDQGLKQSSSTATEVADVRLQECREMPIEGGASAPLVLRQDESAQAALEAYRGLRTRLMRAQSQAGLHSIAITSSLPNEGKTITVMNLGLCYSQLSDQRVLIIDADLRTAGLTRLLGHPNQVGLAQVLTGQATPGKAILATDQKNLSVLPTGSVSTPAPEHFTGPRWKEFLGWCAETFKVVLVDTPPALPLADFELISSACDGIMMVVRAYRTQQEVLQKAVNALDSKKLLGVVLNATEFGGKNSDGYGYDYSYSYGKKK